MKKKVQKSEKKTQKSEKKTVKGEKKMKKSKSKTLAFRSGSEAEKLYQLLSKPHSRKWLSQKFKSGRPPLWSLTQMGEKTGLFKVIHQKDGKYLVKKAA